MIPIWNTEIPFFRKDFRQFPPSLTDYPVAEKNAPACVVIPGGGYEKKSWDQEGTRVAEWLNSIGISAYVLDYRISPYRGDAIRADGLRSVEFLRENAETFGIDPNRIGVCGFSAGGHLAGCCATTYEKPEQRPDFAILCYAVLTLETNTHRPTARVFLGKEQIDDSEKQREFSPIRRVRAECPPAYFWTTKTDATVPPNENTVAAYEMWKSLGIETELTVFDHGAHGLGIPENDPEIASWTDRCAEFLRKIGIIG